MFEGKRRGGEGGARVLLLDVLDMEYSEGEPKKYHRNYFWKYLENITDVLDKEYSKGEPK